MTRYAVTAFGVDRPGVVAALTWLLVEVGGNLEDVSSTSLHGRFTMMLVVDTSETRDVLHRRLSEIGAGLGVSVTVDKVGDGEPERTRATHVMSIFGPDRPGIVARISRLLADRAVNITDLSCRPLLQEGAWLYSMRAEVVLPSATRIADFENELAASVKELGMDLTFEPIARSDL